MSCFFLSCLLVVVSVNVRFGCLTPTGRVVGRSTVMSGASTAVVTSEDRRAAFEAGLRERQAQRVADAAARRKGGSDDTSQLSAAFHTAFSSDHERTTRGCVCLPTCLLILSICLSIDLSLSIGRFLVNCLTHPNPHLSASFHQRQASAMPYAGSTPAWRTNQPPFSTACMLKFRRSNSELRTLLYLFPLRSYASHSRYAIPSWSTSWL